MKHFKTVLSLAFFIISIILSNVFCATGAMAKSENSETAYSVINLKNVESSFHSLLEKFCQAHEPEATPELLGWKRTWDEQIYYDHIDVLKSFQELFTEYVNATIEMNACINSLHQKNKSASNWTMELKKKFGIEYLIQNRKDLYRTVFAICLAKDNSKCEPQFSMALFKEYKFHSAIKRYLEKFISFYQGLDQRGRNSIEDIYHSAKQYLETNQSKQLSMIFYPEQIETEVSIRTIKRKNYELYEYISSHKYFDNPPKYFIIKESLDLLFDN